MFIGSIFSFMNFWAQNIYKRPRRLKVSPWAYLSVLNMFWCVACVFWCSNWYWRSLSCIRMYVHWKRPSTTTQGPYKSPLRRTQSLLRHNLGSVYLRLANNGQYVWWRPINGWESFHTYPRSQINICQASDPNDNSKMAHRWAYGA